MDPELKAKVTSELSEERQRASREEKERNRQTQRLHYHTEQEIKDARAFFSMKTEYETRYIQLRNGDTLSYRDNGAIIHRVRPEGYNRMLDEDE